MNDFERSLRALADAGVDFVIIGGVAASAHGSAYLTYDLDICYDRNPANIQRLAEALQPHTPRLRGAPAGLPFRFEPSTISSGMNFTLTTDLGDLDLFGEVTGIGQYDKVKALAITVELFGRNYDVLSAEGLILSKRAAGRPKDLLVLPELEALREIQSQLEHGQKEAEVEPPNGASRNEEDKAQPGPKPRSRRPHSLSKNCP
jgi:hypothetical protein